MNILFMCVANSARSQLAEGLARKMLSHRARVESAGSEPGKLNPQAVKVMLEAGIDISRQFSKSVESLAPNFLAKLDYVITLCAEEVCPILLSKAEKLHWPFPDPANRSGTEAERLACFREARDAIAMKISAFAQEKGLS